MSDNLKNWSILRSEKGAPIPLFSIRYDYLRNPRNQKEVKAIVLEANDSANVVALTPDKNIVLVEQYRFGTGTISLECPGGFIDEGETPEEAVKRELKEETGYEADRQEWKYLGKVTSNPVFMDSYIHHFLVKNVRLFTDSVQLHLDETEDIRLVELSPEEVKAKVANGSIHHPHTLSALMRVFPIFDPILEGVKK